MNLILFRREEIKSSVRTDDDDDDDDDDDNDADNHDDNDEVTTPATATGTGKRKRRRQQQQQHQHHDSTSEGFYNYLVHLKTDVVDTTKKDPRIVHLTKHLKKTNVGDTFKVGILNGLQGRAMIYHRGEKRKSSDDELFVEMSSFLFDFDPLAARTVTSSSSSLSSDQNQASDAAAATTTETDTMGVTVLLSMPFPKRMKALWSQISSFGCVRRVCIVRGQLSDPNYIHSSAIKPQTFEPLILEGLSQGCHTRNVDVDVSSVNNVLDQQILDRLGVGKDNDTVDNNGTANNDLKLILDCGFEEDEANIENDGDSRGGGGGTSTCPVGLLNVLLTKERNRNVVIAIGSERGWTEDEARLFSRNGFQSVTLGPSILRTDTAVISALAVISSVATTEET